jgi:two-component system, chemotaxis family, protein-glutamate methylesterase/glutaminase
VNQQPQTLVVVGCSAGGVEALSRMLRSLPVSSSMTLLIAIHSAAGESHLPRVLQRASGWPTSHAEDGSEILLGQIFVAPPNNHLIIEDGRLRTVAGARRNGHRPSINALFESAAIEWGAAVIGVILSGALDDGTMGLVRIKQAGGKALVQDPDNAMFSGMPKSAIEHVRPDFVGSTDEIAAELSRLAQFDPDEEAIPVAKPDANPSNATGPSNPESTVDHVAGFACPECGGVLREERVGNLTHFRCHVGHELSERSLLNAQGEQIEYALWLALRTLEERRSLVQRAAERARSRNNYQIFDHFRKQSDELAIKAGAIRTVLLGDNDQRPVTALQEDYDALPPTGSSEQD